MSAIYFHSERDTKAVRGVERHMFSSICSDLAWEMFGGISEFSEDKPQEQAIEELLTGPLRLDQWKQHAKADIVKNRLNHGGFGDELKVNWFTVTLNTVFAIGGDPLKLIARIHGQCEVHCWVSGEHRAWLASIIERGRAVGLYRKECGWEAVVEMLRAHDDQPVVLSYSVCESFPNSNDVEPPEGTDPEKAENGDWFYDLTKDETWAIAFPALRDKGQGLQLSPDNWNDFYFGDGATALTWRDRVNERASEIYKQSKADGVNPPQRNAEEKASG